MTVFYNKTKNLVKRVLLRQSQTKEEKNLWAQLRNRKLGYKFRRQYSVGPYVLDFYCPSRKLAIELDGHQHKNEKVYDKERTEYLAVFGIKVLRFWNSEVNDNINGVLEKITNKLNFKPSP